MLKLVAAGFPTDQQSYFRVTLTGDATIPDNAKFLQLRINEGKIKGTSKTCG